MSVFTLSPNDALYYEHYPPESDKGCTFVFFNALTADTSAWETVIARKPDLLAMEPWLIT